MALFSNSNNGGNCLNRCLTEDEVREIRQRRKDGAIYPDLAKMFVVSLSTVYNVVAGITYKDVK